ncbi:MAG: riboflavin kinase, partial [bacterium]
SPETLPLLLTPHVIKRSLLADLGVDLLVAPTFDRQLANIPPREFIEEILANRLMARNLLVGFNFRFGRGGHGDAEMLASYEGRLFNQVRVIPAFEFEGSPLSSTRIRQAILDGDLPTAESMLGRRYRLAGKVVPGDGRGRVLGFPTANLEVPNQAIPPAGIYGSRVFFEPTSADAINGLLYIGSAPTFHTAAGEHPTRVEIFLMNWEGDLYDQELFVEVICHIREDKTFQTSQDLVKQIEKDRDFFTDWLYQNP